MTGTAATEGPEFSNIYNLAVTVVPTNQSAKRTDESDVVFRTEEGEQASSCVCLLFTGVSTCCYPPKVLPRLWSKLLRCQAVTQQTQVQVPVVAS